MNFQNQSVFETTPTALREKSKLQRHFRRFDVFFFLICTVVTIDTIGAVASNGAQGFTWLIFLGVLFFLPYALSVAELGSAFPQEGGSYIWSRLAFGRPLVAMNLLSGVVSTVLMIAAFQITGANSSRYFAAVLGLTISTTTISYLFIFPALVKLRYSRPDVERPYRVPGGMAGAWICSVVPTFWALLATVALIWPGFGVNWFGGGGNPNDNLAALSFSHQRLQYELTQIVPLAVIVGVGVVFYLLGGKTRRETAAEPVAPADDRSRRTAPSSCGRASRTGGTTRRPT
jgi:amino acid transporter